MILAALDQQQSFVGGGGGSALLDFVGNSYTINGSPITLADVVDLTGRRSSSGLQVVSGAPVEMLGDVRDILLAGQWTVVIEFAANSSAVGDGIRAFLLTVWNADLAAQAALYTQGASSQIAAVYSEDPLTGPTRFWQTDDSAIAGTSKLAWTRTDSHSAGEMNGGAVNIDSTDNTAIPISSWLSSPTRVQLADGNDGSTALGYIRTITIMSPQGDADLPALTA